MDDNFKRMYITTGKDEKRVYTKTEGQNRVVKAIENNHITIISGTVGTGKTHLAVSKAFEYMKKKEYEKLIITRPVVESGEHLGHLPGTFSEKLDPYLRPIYDILKLLENGTKVEKEICPLAYMRGRTFNDSIVILDEANNATIDQIKMILTRIGLNTKIIITGDPEQCDLRSKSGLVDLISRLENQPIKGIEVVTLSDDDVVRNPLIKEIIKLYR